MTNPTELLFIGYTFEVKAIDAVLNTRLFISSL